MKSNFVLVGLLLVIVVLVFGCTQASLQFSELKFNDGKASVAFPATPTESTNDLNIVGFNSVVHSYHYADSSYNFDFLYEPYSPSLIDQYGEKAILKTFVDKLIEFYTSKNTAKLISRNEISLDGILGEELFMAQGASNYKIKVYLHNYTFYELVLTTFADKINSTDANTFYNSLKLLD